MDFFDLHCDTPTECYRTGQAFSDNDLAVSAKKGAHFERWSQFFAIWIRDDAEFPYQQYRSILADFSEKIFASPQNLTPYFSVEGGAVLEERIERLQELKRDGICAMTLTWNGSNRIAGGADTDTGLTDFGRAVVREMNRLGMACDLSHLNERSFFEVLEYAEKPYVSHTACRALVDHRRNLDDVQLKQLAERGGIIGLCCYPTFAGTPIFEALYRNIEHLLSLNLEDHIAIGSDFDGAKMAPELKSLDQIPDFTAFLRKKGLSDRLISKIFYANAQKFFVCL